ncbi:hypothetical protein AB0M11_28905 [Streptomyces sp. NPDC051987]|uniref:hypothetical protein n=1 Tax=Streptomyces sp. NPDC051987 TaxID=3155808 RepID=UPI00342DAA33
MDPGRRRRAPKRLRTAVEAACALPLSIRVTSTTPRQTGDVQLNVDCASSEWGVGCAADLTLADRGMDLSSSMFAASRSFCEIAPAWSTVETWPGRRRHPSSPPPATGSGPRRTSPWP